MKVVVLPHGMQRHYTVGFVNGLSDCGVSVDLVVSENMDSALLRSDIICTDLGQNTNADLSFLKKIIRLFSYHMRLISYVLKRRKNIIHVAGILRFEILMGIIEGVFFRFLCRNYVLTVHNILPHDSHTNWRKLLYKIIYNIPNLLVVHTDRMRQELIRHYSVAEEKIAFMQHGLNDVVPDHGMVREHCKEKLDLPLDKCLLLFFGNILPYKGLETLLEAFNCLGGEYCLVIAGKVSAEYGRKINRLIEANRNKSRIIIETGWIEDKDVATYFRAVDVLLMPYKHIDQSGILFLALRFGLPVICFDVGALKEYITKNVGVVVRGNQANHLVTAIEKFYREAEHYSREHIKKQAQRFQWRKVLSQLLEAYEK
ncbi:MAG: hypothetical protein BA864_06560 [Desulfuromonadales bacterium C00003093]|nr:MAG: hypothetical protein BA864_06560 [Desulfuromonadales bacterium C00003093]